MPGNGQLCPPYFFPLFWQIMFWIVSCVAVLLVNTIQGLIPQKICFLCVIEVEMFKKLLFDVFGQKTTFWSFWAYSGYFFPKNLLKSMGNLYLGYYQHCHALIFIWNGFWVILWLGQIWKSHYFNRGGIPGHCACHIFFVPRIFTHLSLKWPGSLTCVTLLTANMSIFHKWQVNMSFTGAGIYCGWH